MKHNDALQRTCFFVKIPAFKSKESVLFVWIMHRDK